MCVYILKIVMFPNFGWDMLIYFAYGESSSIKIMSWNLLIFQESIEISEFLLIVNLYINFCPTLNRLFKCYICFSIICDIVMVLISVYKKWSKH